MRLEFHDARDGTLSHLKERKVATLVRQLASTLSHIKPTLVLLPCRADGSTEHNAFHTLSLRASSACQNPPHILEFPVWSWWNPLLLYSPLRKSPKIWRTVSPDHQKLKQQVLAIFATQASSLSPAQPPMLSPEFIDFFTRPEKFFFES